MLAIKIDNPEIESAFKKYAKQQRKALEDVVSEAMKLFLDMHKKDDKLIYIKQDPMQHIVKSNYTDDGECLDDVKPYAYVKDSAQYIHDLRRERK